MVCWGGWTDYWCHIRAYKSVLFSSVWTFFSRYNLNLRISGSDKFTMILKHYFKVFNILPKWQFFRKQTCSLHIRFVSVKSVSKYFFRIFNVTAPGKYQFFNSFNPVFSPYSHQYNLKIYIKVVLILKIFSTSYIVTMMFRNSI